RPILLKTPYSAGVHPTAITQPYNIVRFPNGALTVRFRSIGPQTPQHNVQARESYAGNFGGSGVAMELRSLDGPL
ncbi:TPA: hypothetical protein ACH9KC_005886, partial [Escherichia coli]